jgi:tetratricopeptide (TPR) repeat protein
MKRKLFNSMPIAIGIIAMGIILLSGVRGFASGSEDIDALLQSEELQKRVTKDGILELLDEMKAILAENPDDYTANWQYAALLYFYGDYYATDPETKKHYFTACKDYAQKSVNINPNGVAANYWLGVGYAKWSESHGILRSLFNVGNVLRYMSKTIELDPSFFRGVPWGIRATVYAFAPRVISVGNPQKAREDIEAALKYGPDYRVTHQVAANVLIQLQEWEQANEVIEKGLALPFNPLLKIEEEECIKQLNSMKSKVNTELAKK